MSATQARGMDTCWSPTRFGLGVLKLMVSLQQLPVLPQASQRAEMSVLVHLARGMRVFGRDHSQFLLSLHTILKQSVPVLLSRTLWAVPQTLCRSCCQNQRW